MDVFTLKAELVSALADQQRLEEQIAFANARDAKYAELQDIIKTEIDAGRPVVFRLAQVDVERAEVARQIVNLEAERAEVKARLVDLVGAAPSIAPPELSFHNGRAARKNSMRFNWRKQALMSRKPALTKRKRLLARIGALVLHINKEKKEMALSVQLSQEKTGFRRK